MPGYGDDSEFADYAAANGYDIPTGTVAAARLRDGCPCPCVGHHRSTTS